MSSALADLYTSGAYLAKNPTWHEEGSPFKAKYIAKILSDNRIPFASVAEVGCGAGGVLRNLRRITGRYDAKWQGYDISGAAISLARQHPDSDGILFLQDDILNVGETSDVLLVIDVFEHVPDYLGFLEICRRKARYKIYHIPLDLHVSAVLRESYLNLRQSVGHLHYFSEKTARATLVDTGHTIIDTILTPGAIETFENHPSTRTALVNILRSIFGWFSPALSARLFGGYSLLVLAR